MSAETSHQVLLTLDEVDELNSKLSNAYALADVLNASYRSGDGPEPENTGWVAGLVFEYLQDVKELWKRGKDREKEARQGGAA